MNRKMLRAKIHRATVTHANLEYEGSLSIPLDIMAAADLKEYEAVWVWNVTRATRFETYAIAGQPNSRDISANGGAAHFAKAGDIIVIACFAHVAESELATFKPKLVFVDEANRPKIVSSEVAGPQIR